MKVKHALFCFFVSSISLVCSQEKEVKNSTEVKTNKSYFSSDTKSIDIEANLRKANAIYRKSSAKAVEYVQEALVESKRLADVLAQAKCYDLLGEIYKFHSQDGLAEKNYSKSATLYFQQKKTSNYHSSLTNLARAQLNQNKNSLAKQNAEKIVNLSKDPFLLINLYEILGEVHYRAKNYDRAIIYFDKQKSQEMSMNKRGGSPRAEANLAKVYADKNELEKSEVLLKKSLNTTADEELEASPDFDLNEEVSSSGGELDSASSYSLAPKQEYVVQEKVLENYRNRGLVDKEIEVREELLEKGEFNTDRGALRNNRVKLAEAYIQKGDYNEAVDLLSNNDDEEWAEEDLTVQTKTAKVLSEALSKSGKNEEALDAYKKYVELQDKYLAQREKQLKLSSTMATQQSKTEAIEKDFDLFKSNERYASQKEETIQAQLRTQKLINYGLLFLLLIISMGSYFIYRNAKAKRKANQLLALKSLRSQMNPHFIFNALNSVNSFISKNDERAANKFLTDFSKLMRMVLESSHEDIVPLHQEVSVIDLYLKLEQYRFRDKFDYSLSISNEIDQDTFLIPPMLIQPFIENAVWHGLRYKESFGKLKVSIGAEDEKILVVIEDDGIGRARSADLKTKNQKTNKSRGLQNTKERIKVINELYRTSLKLEVSNLNTEAVDIGTVVKLTIPQIEK